MGPSSNLQPGKSDKYTYLQTYIRIDKLLPLTDAIMPQIVLSRYIPTDILIIYI